MLVLGPVGFLLPWLLLALAALPVLWLLLRAVPPAPVLRRFPGVALLLGLRDAQSETDKTPWWLLLLRILAIAAVILGFAGPVLNPVAQRGGTAPLLIVADATWADAHDWAARQTRIEGLLAEAERAGRMAAVVSLTDLGTGDLVFQPASAPAALVSGLRPEPWQPDAAEIAKWAGALTGSFETSWLSDGLARDSRAGLLAALGLLIFLFTSKDIRTGVFFLFKSLMRSLTGTIVQLDPIAIMKIYVQDMKEKREKMQEQINTLAGQLVKLNKKIGENNENIKQKFAEANRAKQMTDRPGMAQAAQLATIEGAGLQDMNEKLMPLQRNMQTILAFMEKVNTSADYLIKETEIKVKLKEIEYKIVKESSNALRTAISIFKGDPDKKFYFDQSMEYIQDDMSMKLGEMKRAMDLSMDFINGVDIQNGILSDKGQQLLEAYNKGEFSLVSTAQQPEQPRTIELNAPKDAGYRNLLD